MEKMLEGHKVTGFEAGGFTFAQPNGVNVTAPLEIWVAAILSALPDAKKAEICTYVDKIKSHEIVVQSTDGYPLHFSTLGG